MTQTYTMTGWMRRAAVAAVLILAMQTTGDGQTGTPPADLGAKLREGYDVVALQRGVALVPRQAAGGVRLIQVEGGVVTVDGQSMRLDRADYDFRAVALNPGDHTVRMVYWPKSFEYGLWSAFTGVILLISWSVMTFYHNKHYEA